MGIFLKSMPGAYAYILIFQIVVVAALFLFLLWLLVRRIQEPRSLPAGTPSETPTAVQTEGNAQLQSRIAELEEEISRSRGVLEESSAMGEKVKYLESKLLEYEILQEEIGTLSSLKVENEQLKQQIMEQSFKTKAPPKENPVSETVLTPAASEPTVMAESPTSEPTTIHDAPTEPENAPVSSVETAPVTMSEVAPKRVTEPTNVSPSLSAETPPLPFDAPAPAATASMPSTTDDLDGLSTLLEQIDQLTKPTDKHS